MSFRKCYVSRDVAAGTQRLLGRSFTDGKEYSNPGIVTPAAKQIDHILQWRMMHRRPAGRERAFDVSQQLAGGTISFQGRVPEGKKIGASVMAGAARVNGLGSALGKWALSQVCERTC